LLPSLQYARPIHPGPTHVIHPMDLAYCYCGAKGACTLCLRCLLACFHYYLYGLPMLRSRPQQSCSPSGSPAQHEVRFLYCRSCFTCSCETGTPLLSRTQPHLTSSCFALQFTVRNACPFTIWYVPPPPLQCRRSCSHRYFQARHFHRPERWERRSKRGDRLGG